MTKRDAVLLEFAKRTGRSSEKWDNYELYLEVCRVKRVWRGMMQRCYDPSDASYKNYGAVGVRVDPEWHNVNTFVVDLIDTHRADLSLDRTDTFGGYSPSNCRWATAVEQARNKRNNLYVQTDTGQMLLVEYAERLGADAYLLRSVMHRVVGEARVIGELPLLRAACQSRLRVKTHSPSTLDRLAKDGGSRAYTHRVVEHEGRTMSLRAASKLTGIPYQTLYARHRDVLDVAGAPIAPPLSVIVDGRNG